MTQSDLNDHLHRAMTDGETWKIYKPIFDNKLSIDIKKVTYMRTILSTAGPLADGNIRYLSLEDRKKDQTNIVAGFQEKVRDLTAKESDV